MNIRSTFRTFAVAGLVGAGLLFATGCAESSGPIPENVLEFHRRNLDNEDRADLNTAEEVDEELARLFKLDR